MGRLGANPNHGGYERGPLASALARLSGAARDCRERFNGQFASALAVWNQQGAHFDKLTGVESTVERYVAPLAAKEQPVLVIILDGRSYAGGQPVLSLSNPILRRESSELQLGGKWRTSNIENRNRLELLHL